MEFYTHKEIAPNVYAIRDCALTIQYLVVGAEKAALLDCGIGAGNIYEYVRRITDKPLIVLITHGHLDHAMGSGTLAGNAEQYMSPLDYGVYSRSVGLEQRKGYVHQMVKATGQTDPADSDWFEPAPVDCFLPLAPGDLFDLGGEVVEIREGGGHTPGSITMLLQNARLLITGDAINPCTFLFDVSYCMTVSDLKKSLTALKAATEGRYDHVLLNHGPDGFASNTLIDGGLWLCDAILENRDRRIPTSRMGRPCYSTKLDNVPDDIGDHSETNILYSDATLK